MKEYLEKFGRYLLIVTGSLVFSVFLIPVLSFPDDKPMMKGPVRDVTKTADGSSWPLPEVVLSISFDMERRLLKGDAKVTVTGEGERELTIQAGPLKIDSLKFNGNSLEPRLRDGKISVKTDGEGVVEIKYRCASENDGPCVINEKGVFLRDNWYPSLEGLSYFRLTAVVPDGLTAVSEAEEIKTEKAPEGNLFSFSFPHPVEGIHFIAGKFTVRKESFDGLDLYAYFFPEDTALAEDYLEHARKYIRLYEGLIGKFPFKRFSVVENFLPTGYSMPTFTLLGQDVVRLPFIVSTSLGHEVLHQWFGNLVYIDYEKGNWAEGLTTYLSDHLYEELEGRGWQYRKQILLDYESYVRGEKEAALRDFRERTDFASRATGYGKSAMLFHMLKTLVGEEVFYRSLRDLVETRRFGKASWGDVRAVFEKASGTDLGRFFTQWTEKMGLPSFEIKNLAIGPKGLRSSVSFDIVQEADYDLDIPVIVRTDSGSTKRILKVTGKRQGFEIIVDGTPEGLVIDEDYDLFRKLSPEEVPPVIAGVLGEDKGYLILPGKGDTTDYEAAVEFFKKRNYTVRTPEEARNEDLAKSSVVVLGNENPLLARLFAVTERRRPGLTVSVKKNPLNLSKVIAIINSGSPDELRASLGKILHYGKYSELVFEGGKNTVKITAGSSRGRGLSLKETIRGFEVPKAADLREIVEKVADKKIIYVGEQHDKYEHHVAQLEVIRGLYRKGRKLAIGMEMFQRPYQKALDDYIEGRIDEREFLKSSAYFKTWGLDYNYYKNILRFARDERIPVIALNIRREIVNKVARSGIDSLSAEESKELPSEMDMTDGEYRQRLKEVFESHEGAEGRNFDNFYQSQVIWDEIMSQSVDEFLRKNPDHQVVVIAGGGHFAFSSGIPKRTFRRNGLDYAVILNENAAEEGISDFILFPESLKVITAPKLMAMLKEDGGRVRINAFAERSVSEKAGLKTGDVIVSLDGTKIASVEDIQIFLFFKKPGDSVKAKVLRKRFLFGERELEFDITL